MGVGAGGLNSKLQNTKIHNTLHCLIVVPNRKQTVKNNIKQYSNQYMGGRSDLLVNDQIGHSLHLGGSARRSSVLENRIKDLLSPLSPLVTMVTVWISNLSNLNKYVN